MAEENQNSNGSETPVSPDNGNGKAEASFDVSAEIQKLQEQAEKYKNDFLYARAEFDNYRKNMIKERSDLIKYGCERLANDILGVVDNFERALQTTVTIENFPQFRQGVELIAAELKNALEKNGIKELPSEGVDFDPNIHEALASEVTDQMEPGKVLRVFQKAYQLHDRLLRPARVVVAKKADS